jgi:T-complex protein 1 subunit theta
MNKMVINHLEKLFVTADAHTIINESDVHHPAAKMVAQAVKMQSNECGDNTNLILTMAGELMTQAAGLIQMGLHPSEILIGYDKASKKALELLETLDRKKLTFAHEDGTVNIAELESAIKPVIASKQYGNHDWLSAKIAEACVYTMPKNKIKFNVDNVRIQKILGGGINDSQVIHGVVVTKASETSVKRVTNAKVAVFNTNIEMQQGETKGTVLLKNADDLLNYTTGEEEKFEGFIKKLAEAGVNCVVCQGSMSELAIHYFEKYGMMAVKIMSKWELKRVGRACGATPIVKLECPTPEEMGYADEVHFQEISSTWCTVFRRDREENKMATIVLRGATNAQLDDIERAIDNGVNAVKSLIRDPRMVPGAGATELYLGHHIQLFAKEQPGLDQYAVEKFGAAFEVIPRILSENAGHKAETVIANMYAKIHEGSCEHGIDVVDGNIKNMTEAFIMDSLESKSWALKLAFDVCLTILKVD